MGLKDPRFFRVFKRVNVALLKGAANIERLPNALGPSSASPLAHPIISPLARADAIL